MPRKRAAHAPQRIRLAFRNEHRDAFVFVNEQKGLHYHPTVAVGQDLDPPVGGGHEVSELGTAGPACGYSQQSRLVRRSKRGGRS